MFISRGYIHISKERRDKRKERSKKLIFVGFDKEYSNYRLWNLVKLKKKFRASQEEDVKENQVYVKLNFKNVNKLKKIVKKLPIIKRFGG